MQKYKYILFDLDGTLTDSAEGIINSAIYSLSRFGISVEDKSFLNYFVGPPVWESFSNYPGFKQECVAEAVRSYREYYRDIGIYQNKPYPGIDIFLQKLKSEGKTLVLSTLKPTPFAVRILKHFNIYDCFSNIYGSDLDKPDMKKSNVIQKALEECCQGDIDHTVMVGDRRNDIVGAKKNNIASIGVLYGYGTYDELTKAGADILASDLSELYTQLTVTE